jgi:protein phosphatase 1 regulatory subunit 7
MTSSDAAPPGEQPASTPNNEDVQPQQEKNDHKPRDSKGWDGKLRLGKKKSEDGEKEGSPDGVESEAEQSEDEGPPPEQLAADEDLLDDTPEDEDQIDLVHYRISSIPALRLERFTKLKVSILDCGTLRSL